MSKDKNFFDLYYDLDELRTPPDFEEFMDNIAAQARAKRRAKDKEVTRGLLESLNYIYIHGEKYVAIEDVLTLI